MNCLKYRNKRNSNSCEVVRALSLLWSLIDTNDNYLCKCTESSHLQEVFLFSVCPHLAFSPRWLCCKHVRYKYPTMHLSPSLESLSKCVFLYSILLSPWWVGAVRRVKCSRYRLLFVALHVLCSFFALSIPHTVFFLLPPLSGQSSFGSFPQRYIACVWLHVSNAFWLLEPPSRQPSTSLLLCLV